MQDSFQKISWAKIKMRNKINVIFSITLVILQVLCFSFVSNLKMTNACQITVPKKEIKKSELTSAQSMVTMEASTGRILYSHEENKRLPMASTTKILTAIVAIENSKNLDEKLVIPKQAVGIEGSSIYLRTGEHLSLRELLYGLMLRSGNDSAVAIAVLVGGSLENFVKMMNDYCTKLGLENTHIVTVNGLHDENHYTSAHDLAKITAYAMKNETFASLVKTKEKTIDNELGKKEKIRYLKNKNRLLNMVEGADGVKTGYTTKAGRCFVGSATRNGMQVICVVLNCVPMFEDTASLIEKAFSEFEMVKLFSKGDITNFEIKNKKSQIIPVKIEKDIVYPLSKRERQKVTAQIELTQNIKFPHSEETPIGEVKVCLENNLIFSEKLYTINIEKQEGFEDALKKILKVF